MDTTAKHILTGAAIVLSTLVGFRIYIDLQKHTHHDVAFLAEGAQIANAIKQKVSEHFTVFGRFPSSNRDIGLPAGEEFTSQSLTAVSVGNGGVITITFNEYSGVEGGTVLLQPKVSDDGVTVEWRCHSEDYQQISEILPQCVYR